MRKLVATRQFQKDFRKIPSEVQETAEEVVQPLRTDPNASTLDIKKLQGFSSPIYRARIGQYRLIYSLTKTTLTLHRIRHRKDIYRRF